MIPENLTDRQRREVAYHSEHARRHQPIKDQPVSFDVLDDQNRRWWNAYWHTYTRLLRHDLRGKKVLVPGCGFGNDAVRLARLGAHVFAFDISPEVVDVFRQRIDRFGYSNIEVSVGPCEEMDFPDSFFDLVFFLDILHHVDIPRTTAEVQRVLKPAPR